MRCSANSKNMSRWRKRCTTAKFQNYERITVVSTFWMIWKPIASRRELAFRTYSSVQSRKEWCSWALEPKCTRESTHNVAVKPFTRRITSKIDVQRAELVNNLLTRNQQNSGMAKGRISQTFAFLIRFVTNHVPSKKRIKFDATTHRTIRIDFETLITTSW